MLRHRIPRALFGAAQSTTEIAIRSTLSCVLLVAAVITLGTSLARADEPYPHKPVRMVTSAPGGSSDFAARLIARGLSHRLSENFIVENRGGGQAAIEIIAHAPPDGYNLLYYGSIIWLMPLLQDNVRYDVFKDFSPVSLVVSSPNIVLVHPSVPATSISQLIALAKASPGKLNYGSGGVGSSGHMAAELFKSMGALDMVRIGYRGSGPALNALVSGEVDVVMASAGGVVPQVKAGRLRALAVTSSKRSEAFPNLPTVSESGLPGYEYDQKSGVFAPAGTPDHIVQLLSRNIAAVVTQSEVKQRFLQAGTDVVGSTPQQFAQVIKSEVTRIAKLIDEARIAAK